MTEGDERTADECDGVHVKDYCKECGCPKEICCRKEGAIAERKKLSKLFYEGYNNKLNFKKLEKELGGETINGFI